MVAPPPTPAAVAAVFDPTKTCTSLSATQFDNVLAAYAPGADEFDTPSSASPIVVPPSFTRPVLARIEEAARDSLITMAVERRVAPAPSLAAVTPPTNNAAATEIVPDRRIARRHPATEEAEAKLEQWRPEASLAERYAKHERQRARNMAKMQEESSRGEALLFLGGCAGLLLIWLFFA